MLKKISFILLAALLAISLSCVNKKSQDAETTDTQLNKNISTTAESVLYMLVGTYTEEEGSKGIYLYKLDIETATSEFVSMVEVSNPSYLTISADEQFVYSVSENGEEDSYAHAFTFDKERGQLTLINSQLIHGSSPAYITIDESNTNLFTANYEGASISQFNVDRNGQLSPLSNLYKFEGKGADTIRQKQPHLHCVRYSPDGKFLFATDLGTDKIYRYKSITSVFEGQAALLKDDTVVFNTPEGTGPRHFDFHPNGLYFYLIGELSGEVIVYDYNDGDLREKQRILADTIGAKGSADIHISPNGKFLYASNRLQEDGIAIFSIDEKDGKLTKAGYQLTAKHPRNFAITPNGKLLLVAGRDDNTIEVYSIDNETGLLTNMNKNIEIDKPVCIKFAKVD